MINCEGTMCHDPRCRYCFPRNAESRQKTGMDRVMDGVASAAREMHAFTSGAIRDSDEDKLDYEGFYHPAVILRFAQYMQQHQTQRDGEKRTSDNWQKGIPKRRYTKSLIRHAQELWHRSRIEGFRPQMMSTASNMWEADIALNAPFVEDGYEDKLCAIIFNAQGLLFEFLVDRGAAARPQYLDGNTEP